MTIGNGLDQLENNIELQEPSEVGNKSTLTGSIPSFGSTTPSANTETFSSGLGNIPENLTTPTAGPDSVWLSINQKTTLPTTPAVFEVLNYDLPLPTTQQAAAEYNYYIQEYEEALLTSGVEETAMLDAYGTHLILGNTDDVNRQLLNTRNPGRLSLPPNQTAIEKYFRTYAVNDINENDGFENVILASSKLKDFNSFAARSRVAGDTKYSTRFPFYIYFDMGLLATGRLGYMIEQKGRADFLMRNVAETLDSGDVYERKSLTRTADGETFSTRNKVWDFVELLSYETNSSFAGQNILLGTQEDYINSISTHDVNYDNDITDIDLASSLKDDIIELWANTLDSDKNYTEVVGYRIAKYKIDNLSKPSQNFFFFNSNEVDAFYFLDTQVKPNQNYFYKVFQYSLVIGESFETDGENVNRDAKLNLVENLVLTTDALVTSKPPVYPEVEFRNFIGVDNKLQILFTENNMEMKEIPIPLNSDESRSFDRIRAAQGVGRELPPLPVTRRVTFENDDGIKVYEIFRTTEPPANPLSFADKKWRRVLNTEILDKVSPDTTYYYMFRTIDNHGNVSNPSKPFEVTLVGGISPYLLVNEFKYEDDKVKTHTKEKDFKKFLLIKPAFEQLLIDKIPEGLVSSLDLSGVNKPSLGKAEPKVWGNKYKLRVTSKKTGKKIDFNLEYDYKFEFRDE
jgi:hypothetical protein